MDINPASDGAQHSSEPEPPYTEPGLSPYGVPDEPATSAPLDLEPTSLGVPTETVEDFGGIESVEPHGASGWKLLFIVVIAVSALVLLARAMHLL